MNTLALQESKVERLIKTPHHIPHHLGIENEFYFDETKIDLIKRSICKGATDDELQLFIHACKRTGLDPFMRQIFAVKRWNTQARREVMTIQTGIDGYRLIADRTGKYAPGKDTEFGYNDEGHLLWAKAYIKKMTPDGEWHEISAIAFWEEYVQTSKDGKPTVFWLKKGRIMLSKCAEALALRKSFPAELSGIYTKEELSQEMPEAPEAAELKENPPQMVPTHQEVEVSPGKAMSTLPVEKVKEIESLLEKFPNREEMLKKILNHLHIESLREIPQARLGTLEAQLKQRLQKEKEESNG